MTITHTNKPSVSVVIPNYNHGSYVGSAIQSVLDQVLPPHEIIVVDDGSRDNSKNVLASYGGKIHMITQGNRGLGAARNAGIQAATSNWVGFLDADDQWRPEFLSKILLLAEDHPNADILYCRAQGMDSAGEDLPQVFGGPVVRPEEIYWTLLRTSFLIPSCVVVRRSVLVAHGLFDALLHGCEDWDLWLRLASKHQFVGTSMCLVRYRLHPNTFSANHVTMQSAVQAVVEKNFGPEDGQTASWSHEKRRAYGGACRYHVLSFLRGNDWHSATVHFRKAIRFDRSLALDSGFFYDMALGSQPSGYRGTPHFLDLENNGRYVGRLLAAAFDTPCSREMEAVRRETYGTANLALGLVAYNSGNLALSRMHLIRALFYRPALCRNPLVLGDMAKSLLGRRILKMLKELFKFQHQIRLRARTPGAQY